KIAANLRRLHGAEPLVSVDVEDPPAAGQLQAPVAGGGEVVGPANVVQLRSQVEGDLPAPVGRARVDDDYLVHQRLDGAEAAFQEALSVRADHGRREQDAGLLHHASPGAGVATCSRIETAVGGTAVLTPRFLRRRTRMARAHWHRHIPAS